VDARKLDFVMAHEIILRNLTAHDIPAAFELSREAGWNQSPNDWRTLIELAPQTCLGIEIDEQLVSTATLMCYGKQLAWIGMVLTRSSHRGRGFAKRLLTETIQLADEHGIVTIKLDATDQGQPLYEKLGFRGEQVVERWERAASCWSEENSATSNSSADANFDSDIHAFGADRSTLLKKLAEISEVFVRGHAFLFSRPGRTHFYLGPCVADSNEEVRELVRIAINAHGKSNFYWDIPAANTNVVSLAHELGFVPKRRLFRMVRGQDLHGEEASVYGLAGFEYG
jgi:GNAT superfamily N-acetyltransferase